MHKKLECCIKQLTGKKICEKCVYKYETQFIPRDFLYNITDIFACARIIFQEGI